MSDLLPLAFEGRAIRVELRDATPWFVAADVCRALEIGNPTSALRALDPDERSLSSTKASTGDAFNLVSESGLYTLVLRSRKAVTPGTVQHRFRKWVTSEVLPTLRRTGGYGAPAIDPKQLAEVVKVVVLEVLPPLVDRAVESKLAADPRRAVGEYTSPRDVLDQHKVPSKSRRGLIVSSSARLRAYCALRGAVPKKCPHSGKWLFPVEIVNAWLLDGGESLIRDHLAAISGQARLHLVPPTPS